jgi:hypothetical protein
MDPRSSTVPIMARSSMVPIMASGSATAVKLLIATLAVTGAYVPFTTGAFAGPPAHVTSLSARAEPIEAAQVPEATPKVGAVTVSPILEDNGCDRTYWASSVIESDGSGISYGWRLLRWSAVSNTWHTYLSAQNGFASTSRTVQWRSRIVDNPGTYRVQLDIGSQTYKSDNFHVTC